MFPAHEPKSVKVVSLLFRRGADPPTDSLTLEYEFPDKWILVDFSIQKSGGVSTIVGFNVMPVAESSEEVNSFHLAGKGPLQYMVLLLAIFVPISCIYAFVLCLQSRNNRKWLWAVFILLGVGKFAVNWTTGEWSFTPFALYILGASVTAHPVYAPWMVAVSFPLGAFLFLKRRGSLALAESPATIEEPPQMPPQ
jgi:hypothetical protein